ncbi:MAG: hypothetical protein KA230_09070, partial [Flavobacteriales bacterium]|nr:hypothetical protein [Flavobacteriales bacterium]
CRKKLGEGTLFSNILDPQRGLVHLYFYHDYSTLRTFSLKDELARGDHSLDMITLFPPNAEFARLVAYRTPFHSKVLLGFLLFAALGAFTFGVYAGIVLLTHVIARLRGRKNERRVLPLIVGAVCSLIVLFLVPTLLLNRGVFYFGLGDATDRISPLLAYLPLLLCLLAMPLVIFVVRDWRMGPTAGFARAGRTVHAAMVLVLVGWLFYWDLVLV